MPGNGSSFAGISDEQCVARVFVVRACDVEGKDVRSARCVRRV
jgi:hypothetical protein